MKKLFSVPLHWSVVSIWGMLFLSLLGQFSRLETSFGRVSLHELLMVPIITLFFWKYRSFVKTLLQHKLVWLATAFVFWTALTTYGNAQALQLPELLSEGLAYLARFTLYLVFAAALFLWNKSKDFSAHAVFWGGFLWLIFQAVVGIAQFLLFPDTRLLFYLGWDDHLSRAFGTLLDPGFFGLFMALGAIVSFAFASKSNKNKRLFFVSTLALCMSALALSYSRASYAAFIGGVFTLSFLWRQRSVLLLIPLLVLTLALLPKDGGGEGQNLLRTRSIEAREEVLEYHAHNISPREILVGRGWYYESALALHEKALKANDPDKQVSGTLRNNAQAVDNVYLHILFSTGVVGSALFATWLCVFLWKIRSSAELLAIWTAVLVHSLFSTALLYSWICLLLIVLSFAFQKTKKRR